MSTSDEVLSLPRGAGLVTAESASARDSSNCCVVLDAVSNRVVSQCEGPAHDVVVRRYKWRRSFLLGMVCFLTPVPVLLFFVLVVAARRGEVPTK